MLGFRLMVLHNLYFYNKMMEEIRLALDNHEFAAYKKQKLMNMARNGEDF
jgi:queuine tRNA-ribosyltransferase